MYTAHEILGFLTFLHGIVISRRTFYRITKKLGLKRNRASNSGMDIYRQMTYLLREGYSNLGYRSLWKLLNTQCGIRVTQKAVRLMLGVLDPEGVSLRSSHRLRRRRYCSKSPSFTTHIDGYDKLKPFGISIHGAVDGFSRKILWLKAMPSNKNPRVVARFYIDYIKELKGVPRVVRCDAGTENVVIRDFHIALRSSHGDHMSGRNSFSVGRSTANQRIEMLWSFLKTYFTQFWRNFFHDLIDDGLFNNAIPIHLECIRFCFLDIIQTRLNIFTDYWNSHRIRSQRNLEGVTGIPDVLFHQPLLYDATDYSYPLPCSNISIDRISEVYTETVPMKGCSEEFLNLVELATDTNRIEFPEFTTIQNALIMYRSFIHLLNEIN